MSRGRQHTTWAQKPKNRELMEKVRVAHFLHSIEYGYSSLTYQSCRFCGEPCFQNEDLAHTTNCSLAKYRGDLICRGLWKYGVRHYICSDCRTDVLIGLQPAKSRTKKPPEDLRGDGGA